MRTGFEVSDSGTTLKALEEFNFDDPQDGLIPGVLSVELGLRDGKALCLTRHGPISLFAQTTRPGFPIRCLDSSFWDAIESNIADLLEIIGDWADATDGGGAAASQTAAPSVLWDPETWSDLWATLPQDNPQLYALLERCGDPSKPLWLPGAIRTPVTSSMICWIRWGFRLRTSWIGCLKPMRISCLCCSSTAGHTSQ